MRRVSLLTLTLAACGGDARSTEANDASTPSDEASVPERDATDATSGRDSATVEPDMDSAVPTETAEPIPLAQSRIAISYAGRVCMIDNAGDLQCRGQDEPAFVRVRTGPFVSLKMTSEGALCVLDANWRASCLRLAVDEPTRVCEVGTSCYQGAQPPPTEPVIGLMVQGLSACAVLQNGDATCWGERPPNPTVHPTGATGLTDVAWTPNGACAITREGTLRQWGPSGPREYTLAGAKALGFVSEPGCVLTDQGDVRCLGALDAPGYTRPDLRRYAASPADGCSLDARGAIACWGPTLERVATPPGPFVDVYVLHQSACALREDGEVVCWGYLFDESRGTEQCASQTASLSIDGSPRTWLTAIDAWHVALFPTPTSWGFAAPLGAGYGLFFAEDTLDQLVDGATGALAPRHRYRVQSSYWLPDATNDATGRILCTAPGARAFVEAHGAELRFDVADVAALPACPGTPLAGEIRHYPGGNPPAGSSRGQLAGTPWTADAPTVYDDQGTLAFRFDDGSYALARDVAETFERRSVNWGLLLTSDASPIGKQLVCIGSYTRQAATANAPAVDILGNLSVLPDCAGGSGTITGCVR